MHWAEYFASNFADKGTQRIAAGITPSGEFHIGHLREILTCDILFRAVRNTDGQTFDELNQSERENEQKIDSNTDESWSRGINPKTKDFFKSEEEFLQHMGSGGKSLIEDEPGASESMSNLYDNLEEFNVQNEDFTEFIFIVDDADPLRKVYPFLNEEYEKFVGHQLGNIPPPDLEGKPDYTRYDEGNGESYADHYVGPFIEALKKIGVRPKIIRNLKSYVDGEYAEYIDLAFEKSEQIREIITSVSGRELPDDWYPFNPVGSDGSLVGVKVTGYDASSGLVSWVDRHGVEGTSDIKKGEGKLPWRIEWAAKWALHAVSCEPFGKDHAASGGSYDTGKEIVKLFPDRHGNPTKAPLPLPYEWISIKGGGAMSSSTGNAIGPLDVLGIVPPEIIRFLIAKNQPKRHIDFDTGTCLIELSDEYQKSLDDLEKWAKLDLQEKEKHSKRQKKANDVLVSTIAYSQIEDITEGGYANQEWIEELFHYIGGSSVSFRHLSLLAQLYSVDHDVWKSLYESGIIKENSYQLLCQFGNQNIGSPYIFRDSIVKSSDDFVYEDWLTKNPEQEAKINKHRNWSDTKERIAWEIYCNEMEKDGWALGETHTLPRRLQAIRNWIASEHFPDGYRLRIQDALSENAKQNIDSNDEDYLQALKQGLSECNWEAEEINNEICNLAKERGLRLNDTFQLLYWIFLDQSHGPKLKSILSEMKRQVVVDLLQMAVDELSS